MEEVLVTGGAGYIGSAAVKMLLDHGYKVVVVDNLSRGKKGFVDARAVFIELDLVDKDSLREVFVNHAFSYVFHFAAYKSVTESIVNKVKYDDNILGTKNLVILMEEFKVPKIVFSSSAAVYGNPVSIPITESHPLSPTNYYAETKLACEKIIMESKVSFVILRYFNVAGDVGLQYDNAGAEDVFSCLRQAIHNRTSFTVFGDDYDTRDGSCIRDFIALDDLVSAHILALGVDNEIINVGTGIGVSIKELVSLFEKHGVLSVSAGARRVGDIVVSVASYDKAKQLLGWEPKVSLEMMVRQVLW